MTPHEWRYAAVAAVATSVGAVLKSVLDTAGKRRVRSGDITTSDADELWQTLNTQLARMDARMDKLAALNQDLQVINTQLLERNATLATANSALIDELDALRATNKSLVERNEELLKRLEERPSVRLVDGKDRG